MVRGFQLKSKAWHCLLVWWLIFRDTLRRPRGEVLVVEADAFGAAAALVTLDEGTLALAVFFVRPINLIIN